MVHHQIHLHLRKVNAVQPMERRRIFTVFIWNSVDALCSTGLMIINSGCCTHKFQAGQHALDITQYVKFSMTSRSSKVKKIYSIYIHLRLRNHNLCHYCSHFTRLLCWGGGHFVGIMAGKGPIPQHKNKMLIVQFAYCPEEEESDYCCYDNTNWIWRSIYICSHLEENSRWDGYNDKTQGAGKHQGVFQKSSIRAWGTSGTLQTNPNHDIWLWFSITTFLFCFRFG